MQPVVSSAHKGDTVTSFLSHQVSRLKRQIADFAATNESLMDENARLRVERSRAVQTSAASLPGPIYESARTITESVVTQPRALPDYTLTQPRSAYSYTTGLKVDSPTAPLSSLPYRPGHPY